MLAVDVVGIAALLPWMVVGGEFNGWVPNVDFVMK